MLIMRLGAGLKSRRKLLSILAVVVSLALLIAIGIIVGSEGAVAPCSATVLAEPIPQDEYYTLLTDAERFMRNPDFPQAYQNPVSNIVPSQHPYLAPNANNNMHCDAYMTDTYQVSGPLGINPEVISTYRGFAQCATVTFDSDGRIWTVMVNLSGPYLLLLDPQTLDEIDIYALPVRHAQWADDPIGVMQDTSGGAYFCLDNQNRAVIATHNHTIQVIGFDERTCSFSLVQEYDLSGHVVPKELPARDKVGAALPDWSGRLWYVTRYGIVGTVEPAYGAVHTIELVGEELQNSFTVGEDGVYIVSDYAMYRFHADENGVPVLDWRTEYDRGSQRKSGMINQGSGTTPNLFGDMVAIADNAEPRMNILFLDRHSGELVCSTPVFEDGLSSTENALIGVARPGQNGTEYSVIVENNYGYTDFGSTSLGKSTVGGVARVDLIPDGAGNYTCHEVWYSPEISCTPVPKMSLASGLIYLYTKYPRDDRIDAWYFTTVDFETGDTVYRFLTGTGIGYNNNYAPIALGPDGGIAYVGTLNGLIAVRDRAD